MRGAPQSGFSKRAIEEAREADLAARGRLVWAATSSSRICRAPSRPRGEGWHLADLTHLANVRFALPAVRENASRVPRRRPKSRLCRCERWLGITAGRIPKDHSISACEIQTQLGLLSA